MRSKVLSPNTNQENSGGAKTGETANLPESFVLGSTLAERHTCHQAGCGPETAQELTPLDREPRGRAAPLGSLRLLPSLPGVPSQ